MKRTSSECLWQNSTASAIASSPLIVEGAAEYRALLDAIFTKLTERLSFAGSWIENHLGGFIQKLR